MPTFTHICSLNYFVFIRCVISYRL
ncbi:hypothetical protein HUG15_03840 [Salicibibacter cibarius]|uniref:Uncharacterized protein n=1 Tax=Salicibibacter cibarius TaxID=2743000 RepID=A0A7T7CDN0_9BACI|nr:hypothetical protein HUG15_03840 [Salicibibacter cibarius]